MAQPGVAGGLRRIRLQDFPIDAREHAFVQFAACHTTRRRRDAVGLREGQLQCVAPVPQVIDGGAVTLGVLGRHSAKDQEHQDQRIDHAFPDAPLFIILGRYLVEDRDHLFPQCDKRLPDGSCVTRSHVVAIACLHLDGLMAFGQARLPVGLQWIQQNLFFRGRPVLSQAPPPAPFGVAHEVPIGRPITGPGEPGGIDERLNQHRAIAVDLDPVVPDLLGGQREHVAGEIRNSNPRKDQKPIVAQHQREELPPMRRVPADPVIARRQRPGRRGRKQQTAERVLPDCRDHQRGFPAGALFL